MQDQTIQVPDGTTPFTVFIPSESVDDVITALCSNAGFEVDGFKALEIVKQFVKDQVVYYKQRTAVPVVEPINIQ